MKIVVVGLGYVGLANAVLLSQYNEVIGVDISHKRVQTLNAKKSPIIDVELSRYLNEKDLKISANTDLEASVKGASFVIVSTPTNYDENTNSFDTSTVEAVIKKVIQAEPSACIVVKSTIPVGFIDKVRRSLKTDAVIFSPEFLREGRALYDNLYPSRIIVGEKSERAKKFADLLLQAAIKEDVKVLLTNTREAEAIKLFSNTYLAMRVAFFNELDSFSLANQMDTRDIIDGVSLDPRVGNFYNNPSFGYGGYCLPKDTKQLLATFSDVPQDLISATIKSNFTRQQYLSTHIAKLKPRVVGIYKLQMKVGSDNFRQSAIKSIMDCLSRENIDLIIYEPMLNDDQISGHPVYKSLEEFKKESDLILTNRLDSDLKDVSAKVYTRDLFETN